MAEACFSCIFRATASRDKLLACLEHPVNCIVVAVDATYAWHLVTASSPSCGRGSSVHGHVAWENREEEQKMGKLMSLSKQINDDFARQSCG